MKRSTTTWQLQAAKNRLSEVIDQAVHAGPQVITRHGEETAVVLSVAEWKRLSRQRVPLIEILRRAPKLVGGLEIERARDVGREVKL